MRKSINDFTKNDVNNLCEFYYEGFSIKEIAELFNITYYEVIYILRNVIPDFDTQKYYPYEEIADSKVLIVSDTHIGSCKENLEYLREAYRVAESKGITTAIHTGDLIQSTIENVAKEYTNETKQIEHLLDIYPKGFENYILLGNHDYNTLKKDNYYLEMLESREDFHITGIKRAYLTWRGHLVSLNHPCKRYSIPIESLDTILTLRGHSHQMKTKEGGMIYVPTLSNDLFENKNAYPGFLIGEYRSSEISMEAYNFKNDSLQYKGKVLTKKLR